jgi:membrane-associated phospholipid phosphatase
MRDGPRYSGRSSGASIFTAYGSIPSMVNEYAAMPSMHVGWSIIAGWLLYVASGRRWWVGALALTHVVMMETVVVATGNHYVVDGLAGMAVVAISAAVVHWYETRPLPNQRRLLHCARERA